MLLIPTNHCLPRADVPPEHPRTYLWDMDGTGRLLWAKGGVIPTPDTRTRYLIDAIEASHPHAVEVEDSEEEPEWRAFVVGTPDGAYELREVILYRKPLKEALALVGSHSGTSSDSSVVPQSGHK